MPEISVVIPIYNIEQYIDRCMNAVLGQTFKDFDVYLMDDGSTDRSGEICDEWAKKDERVHVIHKENGGISDCRNKGIAASTGRYIISLDGDDFPELTMFDKLHDLIQRYDADMAICNFRDVWEDGTIVEKRTELKEKVLNYEEFWDLHYAGYMSYCCITWNKIYKRELFDKAKFEYGRANQDNLIEYDLAQQWKKVAITGEILMNYCHRKGSITGTRYSAKQLACPEAEIRRTESFIADKNWRLATKSLIHSKNSLMRFYIGLDPKDRNMKGLKDLKKRYKANYKILKGRLSIRERLAARVFMLNERFTMFLIRIRKKPTGIDHPEWG